MSICRCQQMSYTYCTLSVTCFSSPEESGDNQSTENNGFRLLILLKKVMFKICVGHGKISTC